MVQHSFLDKGVLLGYCFLVDVQYSKCRQYMHSGSSDYYATPQIEDAFRKQKENFIKTHRKEILDHVRMLISNYEGELSENEIEEIREGIDKYETDSWRYLLDFYKQQSETDVHQISNKLRRLAREIEQIADTRKRIVSDMLFDWIVTATYPNIRKGLEPLHQKDEEDFWVILDAHDLATNVKGQTEFATTNPSDFGDEQVSEAIINQTDIDQIKIISVRRKNY